MNSDKCLCIVKISSKSKHRLRIYPTDSSTHCTLIDMRRNTLTSKLTHSDQALETAMCLGACECVRAVYVSLYILHTSDRYIVYGISRSIQIRCAVWAVLCCALLCGVPMSASMSAPSAIETHFKTDVLQCFYTFEASSRNKLSHTRHIFPYVTHSANHLWQQCFFFSLVYLFPLSSSLPCVQLRFFSLFLFLFFGNEKSTYFAPILFTIRDP